jgi:hypothetical protein
VVQRDILPCLLAQQQGQGQQLGQESGSSKASKAHLVELLLELLGRYPVRTLNLIKRHSLHLQVLPLALYGEQSMVLLAVKLLRVLTGAKDPAIIS